MSHIIVVFPRRDNAVNIRNVLVRAGMEVSAVCLTGAKVLQYVDNWSDGIVVCGYRLQDMQYTELREALPFSFDMLLVAPALDVVINGLPQFLQNFAPSTLFSPQYLQNIPFSS